MSIENKANSSIFIIFEALENLEVLYWCTDTIKFGKGVAPNTKTPQPKWYLGMSFKMRSTPSISWLSLDKSLLLLNLKLHNPNDI